MREWVMKNGDVRPVSGPPQRGWYFHNVPRPLADRPAYTPAIGLTGVRPPHTKVARLMGNPKAPNHGYAIVGECAERRPPRFL
jgi:hypothetical protein